MSRVLLIDPFSGASGDMLLAALIDAGADVQRLREGIGGMKELAKVSFDVVEVTPKHFAAKQLRIDLPHEHVHRGLGDVTAIIDAADSLSEGVKCGARDVFTRLAEAEAKVHGTTVDEIHFHEVGALDAILDITGFFIAAESLGIETFRYTRLLVGGGSTHAAHGEIPLPAPATLELLAGHPMTFSGRDEELLTPTAAAIIATVFEPIGNQSHFTPATFGYGAGTRESDGLPNILRVSVGELADGPSHVTVIRCTIDDMNPELYGHTMNSLFETGALEVYFQPVMMKKNRPGVEVTVIVEETDAQRISEHLLAETTTNGVRVAREERVELARRVETIDTPLGPARVKVAVLPSGRLKMSPEFESCRELSETKRVPIREVFDTVRNAWAETQE